MIVITSVTNLPDHWREDVGHCKKLLPGWTGEKMKQAKGESEYAYFDHGPAGTPTRDYYGPLVEAWRAGLDGLTQYHGDPETVLSLARVCDFVSVSGYIRSGDFFGEIERNCKAIAKVSAELARLSYFPPICAVMWNREHFRSPDNAWRRLQGAEMMAAAAAYRGAGADMIWFWSADKDYYESMDKDRPAADELRNHLGDETMYGERDIDQWEQDNYVGALSAIYAGVGLEIPQPAANEIRSTGR